MKKIFLILSARFFDIAIGMICVIIILASVVVTSYAGTITASQHKVTSQTRLTPAKWNNLVNALATAINDNSEYSHTPICTWAGWRCTECRKADNGYGRLVIARYCAADLGIMAAQTIPFIFGGKDNNTCDNSAWRTGPISNICKSWGF